LDPETRDPPPRIEFCSGTLITEVVEVKDESSDSLGIDDGQPENLKDSLISGKRTVELNSPAGGSSKSAVNPRSSSHYRTISEKFETLEGGKGNSSDEEYFKYQYRPSLHLPHAPYSPKGWEENEYDQDRWEVRSEPFQAHRTRINTYNEGDSPSYGFLYADSSLAHNTGGGPDPRGHHHQPPRREHYRGGPPRAAASYGGYQENPISQTPHSPGDAWANDGIYARGHNALSRYSSSASSKKGAAWQKAAQEGTARGHRRGGSVASALSASQSAAHSRGHSRGSQRARELEEAAEQELRDMLIELSRDDTRNSDSSDGGTAGGIYGLALSENEDDQKTAMHVD